MTTELTNFRLTRKAGELFLSISGLSGVIRGIVTGLSQNTCCLVRAMRQNAVVNFAPVEEVKARVGFGLLSQVTSSHGGPWAGLRFRPVSIDYFEYQIDAA